MFHEIGKYRQEGIVPCTDKGFGVELDTESSFPFEAFYCTVGGSGGYFHTFCQRLDRLVMEGIDSDGIDPEKFVQTASLLQIDDVLGAAAALCLTVEDITLRLGWEILKQGASELEFDKLLSTAYGHQRKLRPQGGVE